MDEIVSCLQGFMSASNQITYLEKLNGVAYLNANIFNALHSNASNLQSSFIHTALSFDLSRHCNYLLDFDV